MSGSLNRVQLIGNACADPEIRAIADGTKVASFSLATNESYKNVEGKKIDNVEYHRLVLWKGLAEVCDKYVKKGKKIYVEGKIKNRKWDNKEGVTQYSTEIKCDKIILLGGKDSNSDSGGFENSGYSTPQNAYPPPGPEDDLPF